MKCTLLFKMISFIFPAHARITFIYIVQRVWTTLQCDIFFNTYNTETKRYPVFHAFQFLMEFIQVPPHTPYNQISSLIFATYQSKCRFLYWKCINQQTRKSNHFSKSILLSMEKGYFSCVFSAFFKKRDKNVFLFHSCTKPFFS